jgi:hypothetical protein
MNIATLMPLTPCHPDNATITGKSRQSYLRVGEVGLLTLLFDAAKPAATPATLAIPAAPKADTTAKPVIINYE